MATSPPPVALVKRAPGVVSALISTPCEKFDSQQRKSPEQVGAFSSRAISCTARFTAGIKNPRYLAGVVHGMNPDSV
jgi:hypothetical protein